MLLKTALPIVVAYCGTSFAAAIFPRSNHASSSASVAATESNSATVSSEAVSAVPSSASGSASDSASTSASVTASVTVATSSRPRLSTTPSGTATTTAAGQSYPTDAACPLNGPPNSQCWALLEVNKYINDWWNENWGGCGSSHGFSQCFLDKTLGDHGPWDCDSVTLNNCRQPEYGWFSGVDNAPQKFYAAYAIWNTNTYFVNLYQAVFNGGGAISGALGNITQILTPPSSSNDGGLLLDILTFGLSLYAEGSLITKAIIRLAPQSTSLGSKLLPKSDNTGPNDWTQASGAVANFMLTWAQDIADALPLLVNSPDTFVQLGDTGAITGEVDSLSGLTHTMQQAVGTFAISSIINSGDWVVTRSAGNDVSALTASGSLLWDTGCSGGYDANGLCDQYYYDGGDTYSIIDPRNMGDGQNDVMQGLMGGNEPYTTGQLLFSGAQSCKDSCGQNGNCSPSMSDDQSVVSCLSSLRVCTWSWDVEGPWDGSCTNDPAQGGSGNSLLPSWAYLCPSTGNDPDSVEVPKAYLGGGAWKEPPSGFWQGKKVCQGGVDVGAGQPPRA